LINFVNIEITGGFISSMIQDVLVTDDNGEPIPARGLAKVLGRIAALRISHGNITQIMTRNLQHRLGWIVNTQGWEASLKLREVDREELSWLQANLKAFNGRGIREEDGPEESRQAIFEEKTENVDPTLVHSVIEADLRENGTDSYLLGPDQQFSQITEHTAGEAKDTYAAIQEIDCITQILLSKEEEGEAGVWRRVFWRTTCRLCHVWIRKGVRAPIFRSWIVRFKWAELIAKTEVIPVWQPVLPLEIVMADQRSQTYSSTDEWSVSRACLEEVFRQLCLRPTVDAFASRNNSLCEKFFSKWPQVGSSGMNFFAQSLVPEEIYFCCPPVKDIGHMLNRLKAFHDVIAILAVPHWRGHTYWGMLRQPGQFIPEIRAHMSMEPSFFDTGSGMSLFTRRKGISMWFAVYKSGSGLTKIGK
jgi:hypothetical protein